MATSHEIEDDRDIFEMSIKGRAQAGALSRVFGNAAPPKYRTVEAEVVDSGGEFIDPIQQMIEAARPD